MTSNDRISRRAVIGTGLAAAVTTTAAVAAEGKRGQVAHAPAATAPRRAATRSAPLPELTTPAEAAVTTQYGPVRGYKFGSVYIFKGIPYGGDTGGAKRFLPPSAAKPWTESRLCLAYGYVCPQLDGGDPGAIRRFAAFGDNRLQSEDCLNLNVWSESLDAGAKRPVLVWLHGGGYFAGNSHEQAGYDGTNLAQRGAVVVSVNHRLGVLGYFELSDVATRFESSVNVGMLDLVLALQWVRDNIAKFGGDADRVTIFGHSGGGSKVSTLMAMPTARGLFHRGMVMSGSPAAFATSAEKRPLSAAVMTAAKIRNVTELQQLDVNALLAAGARGMQQLQAAHGVRPRWEPARDGIVVTEDWGKSAPTLARGIPLIVGNVRDEFRDANVAAISDADFAKQLARFGAGGEALLHSLQQMFPQASRLDYAAIANALTWRQNAVTQATRQAANEAPVFNYWFVQPSPLLEGRIGVPHGTDVDHFFDNVSVSPGLTGFSPANYHIADQTSGALLAFAATGNPSVPGLAWTQFNAERVPTMVFDSHSRIVDDPASEARRIAAAVPGFNPFG